MGKLNVGSGEKESAFYVILGDCGPNETIQVINRLAKLWAKWLANQGFLIGISDVLLMANRSRKTDKLVEPAYDDESDALISDPKEGSLEKQAVCERKAH